MPTVAELKSLARDLKITGYSSMKKDELAKAIDDKYREMDGPKRLSNNQRSANYLSQTGRSKLTFRQSRRVRKNDNKAKG